MSYKDLVDSKKAKLEALKSSRLQREAKRKTHEASLSLSTLSDISDFKDEATKLLTGLGVPMNNVSRNIFHSNSSSTLTMRDSSDDMLADKTSTPVKSTKFVETADKATECLIFNPSTDRYCKSTQTSYVEGNDLVDSETTKVEPKVDKSPENILQEKPVYKATEMSEDELESILMDHKFISFAYQALNVVERVLAEEVKDVLVDYSLDITETDEKDRQDQLICRRIFVDNKCNRPCLSLDWSPSYPELLISGYGGSGNDTSGVVYVWNLNFSKKTPEYSFISSSSISSILAPKYNPNYILAGTISGQVLLWDKRVCKQTPSQRTQISQKGHAHRVHHLSISGTSNAHNLVTASNEGRFCTWSLDMLTNPIDSYDVFAASNKLMLSSLAFQPADISNFISGTSEGYLYGHLRDDNSLTVSNKYDGHSSLITGISGSYTKGHVDFSGYFLTSSMDWTVKLWRVNESRPLHTFEWGINCVYGVEWSPVHPALFCSVDGEGRLNLWNLLRDLEFPSSVGEVYDRQNLLAMCSCKWNAFGNILAAGDSGGRTYVYDVNEFAPKMDDWCSVNRVLNDMSINSAEDNQIPST